MISWLSEPTLKALKRYFSKFADTVHSSQLFREEFQYACVDQLRLIDIG